MKIPGNPDAISPSNLTSDNCPAIMKEENANYNGFDITQLPPELHLMLCKYLDTKSMIAICLTNKQMLRSIGTASVKKK